MWRKVLNLDEEQHLDNIEDLKKRHKRNSLIFFGSLLGITAVSLLFREIVANPDVNLTMFYILGIVIVARYTTGYIWGFLFAIASVFSINYFFTYPYHNFNMTLEGYPITFLAMLIIYIITSALTTDLKEQAQILAKQEKRCYCY